MGDLPGVGLQGFGLGFNCLIGHLHAKGVIDKEEFADLLDHVAHVAGTFTPAESAELKALAINVRDRPAPRLSIVGGSKDDENE